MFFLQPGKNEFSHYLKVGVKEEVGGFGCHAVFCDGPDFALYFWPEFFLVFVFFSVQGVN